MSQQNFKRKWSREGESSGDEGNDGKIIGSFSLNEVKSSEDYLRRIETSDAKKRKWALNFGYLGSKYQGLQMNPGRVYLGCHFSIDRIFVAHLFLKETISVLSPSKSQVNLFNLQQSYLISFIFFHDTGSNSVEKYVEKALFLAGENSEDRMLNF